MVVAVAGMSRHKHALLNDSTTPGSAVALASSCKAASRASSSAISGSGFGSADLFCTAAVGEAVAVTTTVFVFLIVLVTVLNLVVTAFVVVLLLRKFSTNFNYGMGYVHYWSRVHHHCDRWKSYNLSTQVCCKSEIVQSLEICIVDTYLLAFPKDKVVDFSKDA